MYDAIFITGSVITPKRTQFFTPSQRLTHTIDCAKSIRKHFKTPYIVLTEGSELSNDQRIQLKQHFDVVLEYSNDEEVQKAIHSPNIGLGEAKLLELCIEYLLRKFDKLEIPIFKTSLDAPTGFAPQIFKITSRYSLANDFDIKEYELNKYNFLPEVCMGMDVYCTQLYSIPYKSIDEFLGVLKNIPKMLTDNSHPIEELFYRLITKDKVHVMKHLGLDGRLSYNGTIIKK